MTSPRLGGREWTLLAATFSCALALRPQLVGVGPLIPMIRDDLGLSFFVAGLLGSIPVLCMGVFAPPAAALQETLGLWRAVTAALAAVGGFGLVRAFAPDAGLLLAATLALGVGMGVAGALLPVVVRVSFPGRAGFATGVYSMGIQMGSAGSAALAVPVATAAGTWRASLVVFSVVTLGLAGVWRVATRAQYGVAVRRGTRARMPLRDAAAWLLVAVFTLAGVAYYGVNAWLPAAYAEQGWSPAAAGGLLAALNTAAVPSGFLAAWASDRARHRESFLVGFALLLTAAAAGLVLAPAGGWVWAVVYGVANGSLFALMMALPVDFGADGRQVAAYAAMMLSGGYVLAALSPTFLGLVRDVTGDFATSLWAIVVTAALLAASCASLRRARVRAHRRTVADR